MLAAWSVLVSHMRELITPRETRYHTRAHDTRSSSAADADAAALLHHADATHVAAKNTMLRSVALQLRLLPS